MPRRVFCQLLTAHGATWMCSTRGITLLLTLLQSTDCVGKQTRSWGASHLCSIHGSSTAICRFAALVPMAAGDRLSCVCFAQHYSFTQLKGGLNGETTTHAQGRHYANDPRGAGMGSIFMVITSPGIELCAGVCCLPGPGRSSTQQWSRYMPGMIMSGATHVDWLTWLHWWPRASSTTTMQAAGDAATGQFCGSSGTKMAGLICSIGQCANNGPGSCRGM